MIFDFKNLSSYGQALKSTATDIGELSKLTSNLTLTQTANILSTKNLNKETMVGILTNKGLTQAEAEAAASKIASATANGVATFSFKAYTTAIWANVKAIGTWMLTNPVGWIIGLGVAIVGAGALIDGLTESIEEQKEKLNELKENYISLKDELSSLDSQIKENIKTIGELQGKAQNGTITLIEEDQLRKLKIQNELLKEQLEAKKDLAKEDKKELSKKNIETFNNEFDGSVDESAAFNFDIKTFYDPTVEYDQTPIKNLVLMAKENEKRLKDALTSGDENLIKLLEDDKTEISNELSKRSNETLLVLLEYQNTLSELMNDDGTFDNADDQKMWDDIESWKKDMYKYSNDSGQWNTVQIDVKLNDSSLTQVQKDLQDKFNAGTLTEVDIEKHGNLITALENANLILEDGQTPASIYLQYLRSIATSQEAVNNTRPDFTFSETNSKIIDDYQSQLNTLNEASKKLQVGSFTSTDLLDLLQSFPELTSKTDDLSYAIQILTDDKLKTLKDILNVQGASPKILKIFDDITSSVQSFSLGDVLSELEGTYSVINDVEEEIKETGELSVNTLTDISTKYPDVIDVLDDYLQGKKDETDIINALKEEYEIDIDNYKEYILTKNKLDTEFYKQIVNGLSDDLINKANQYGIDLGNYRTYSEEKLAIDKEYRIKKENLENAKTEYFEPINSIISGGIASPDYIFDMHSKKKNLETAKTELDEYEKFMEEYDTSIKVNVPTFNLNFTGATGSDANSDDTINSIDWAANSIENLTNKINYLNNAINNESNYKKQLELIKQLISDQEDLLELSRDATGEYSDRYEDSLKKLSSSELAKYQPLIESTNKLSLEMFKGENRQEVFDKVSEAQKAWQLYQQALIDYENQVKDYADAQNLEYQTKQEQYQTKIDRHLNNKNDIQNKIDNQESKYGYADESLYQDLLEENNKLLDDYDDKLENAKKNREKIYKEEGKNSKAYLEADNEVQELQNSVAELTQEQLELNRTILKYPIHKLEEEKELLEEQLELIQEKKKKMSDSISAASELVQGQIDYYSDLKETTEENYNTQIEKIQKQKDALTEVNDTMQQQIALEKAKYNLDRAINQKNVKVLRDREFVYESDMDAVMTAKEELEQEQYNMVISSFDKQIKKLENEKEEALENIEIQIKSLSNYKEQIDSIVSGYESVLRLQSLIGIFGEDSIQRVLNGDTSFVQEMSAGYIDVASSEISLQEQIKLYEDEIEQIEKYANKWVESKETIKKAKEKIEEIIKDTKEESNAIKQRNAATKTVATEWNKTKINVLDDLGNIENGQIIAKDNEAAILESRLETLRNFAAEAKGYLNEISSALSTVEQKKTELNTDNKFVQIGTGTVLLLDKIKSTTQKFHNGMESGYVGEDKKDTFKNISLTKLEPNEIPAILQVGEGVLTKLQQTNVLDNMRTAFYAGTKLPNFNNIQKSNNTTAIPSITFNGDIVLHGVQNVSDLSHKIKSEFLTKLSQELYK